MPSILSRSLFPAGIALYKRAFPALAILALTGCALFPASKNDHPLVDKNEERYFEMTERLSQQDAKIAQLTSRLEAMNGGAKPAEKAPVAKAKPQGKGNVSAEPRTITADDGDPLAPLSENTVATSKTESMHSYFEGNRLLEQGKYDLALGSFRDFLKASPDHVYADRAQFQIAEAHFLNKDYGLVVVATNLLESRYPYSFKVPESILKRALSFEGLGQKDPARNVLKDLIKRYPESPSAKVAVAKLAELGGDSSAPPMLQ